LNTILTKDTLLFHATGEPFAQQDKSLIQLGAGIDQTFWVAKESAIAQTYIPESGSRVYAPGSVFVKPNQNEGCAIAWLQKKVGLTFSNVKWERNQAMSYRTETHPCPAEFSEDNKTWWERQSASNKQLHEIFINTLKEMGYSATNEDHERDPNYLVWELKTHHDENEGWSIKPADWYLPGFLFILKPKRDLTLFSIAQGNEGCLLDPDHRKYDEFDKVKTEGYDGVIINDFAQVERSNFGHRSYGIFDPTQLEIVDKIPATHPKSFHDNHYSTGGYESPEFKEWLEAQNIENHAIA